MAHLTRVVGMKINEIYDCCGKEPAFELRQGYDWSKGKCLDWTCSIMCRECNFLLVFTLDKYCSSEINMIVKDFNDGSKINHDNKVRDQ